MIISGLINGQLVTSIASIVKWLFLLQLILLFQQSFKYETVKNTLSVLLIAYAYPVTMLLFSVVLGIKKATELDGSLSYLGGFYHESTFSNMIYGALLIYLLLSVTLKSHSIVKLFLGLMFGFVLIMLVNYRTTVIAAVIVIFGALYAQYREQKFQFKTLSIAGGVLLVLLATLLDFSSVAERFMEIPEALSKSSVFFSLPEYYSIEDKKFFSGRIYLWSQYISQAMEGDIIQQWFGYGMDSWKKYFDLYAHNTIVSFYYELGILGCTLILSFFIWQFIQILRIKVDVIKWTLLGIYASFILLNMGTMPLWQIEGIIILSLIIALTSFYIGEKNETY